MNTMYKLGAAEAIAQLTSSITSGKDNPTCAPSKYASVALKHLKEALARAKEKPKVKARKDSRGKAYVSHTGAPQHNSKFKSLKKRLQKKKVFKNG